MKKRYVGPPNPGPDGEDMGIEVRVGGESFGVVKSGHQLDIPDDRWKELCDRHEAAGCPLPVWSEELWKDVGASSAKKRDGED